MSGDEHRRSKRSREPLATGESLGRRGFLQAAGLVGVLGFDVLGCSEGTEAAPSLGPIGGDVVAPTSVSAPAHGRFHHLPHRALLPGGVIGYADRLSVAPGETIDFHVSNDGGYTLGIYRLGLDENDPAGDVRMLDFPVRTVNKAAVQPIHPGSYVHVPKRLTETDAPAAFTIECWVRVHDLTRDVGLVTQYDFPKRCGFGLFVQASGAIGFYLGDGDSYDKAYEIVTPAGSVVVNEWSHVVARWDATTMSIWINGIEKVQEARSGSWSPGTDELRLAAYGADGLASHFLNGDLAMPALYAHALDPSEIKARFADRAMTIPAEAFAAWPLTEEKGDSVADVKAAERTGRIVNHATWQIGGPRFNANVPCYPTAGSPGAYRPEADQARGHGLRFCADDLFDCGWTVTHSYRVPVDARSGFYVARFRYTDASKKDCTYHITFVVTRAAAQPKSDVLLLTPTNTFIAYNSKPFRKTKPGLTQVYVSSRRTDEPLPVDEPGFSAYQPHQSKVPAFHMGTRVPMPSFDPYNRYVVPTYGHLMQPVRAVQTWLEASGYGYDVATDLDLHNDPTLLAGYKTVIIAGHSEYWSIPAYQAVQSYLAASGNLLVLSGNTMFWRVSFDPSGSVMECRKSPFGKAASPLQRGELWHSDDGQRGGLLREAGHPAHALIGLETAVVLNPSAPSSFTTIAAPDHFLFEGVNLATFGANLGGHEVDARVSTLEANRKGAWLAVPTNAQAPVVDDATMVTLASATGGQTAALYTYFGVEIPNTTSPNRGDLIYWERSDGGTVVNVGSIRAGQSLKTDPAFATFVKNALQHFGVVPS
jgi:hypothetical protein